MKTQMKLEHSVSFRWLILFALPTIFFSIFANLYTTVDGIFVARFVDTDALSAINIVMPMTYLTSALGMMFGTGGNALVARKIGEGRQQEAREDFSLLMAVAFVFSVVLSILCFLFLNPLCRFLGSDEALLHYCREYMIPVLISISFAVFGMVFQLSFITVGKAGLGAFLNMLGGVLNIVLDWLISAAVILIPSAIIWAVWGYMNAMIVLLHLAVFWGIAALIQWAIQKHRKKAFQRYYAGAIAVLITILYLGVGFVQANHVWQTDYTVTTTKNVGSLRIALLADSHVGTTFDGEGLAKHIARIQEQKPDVVVIVGDFVDEDTGKEDMIAACQSLSQLDTPCGVYYVFGNHDKGLYANGQRGYDGDDMIAELQKNGVTVLQDESVLIDNRFYLVGRQDASEEMDFGGSRAKISDLTKELDKDTYTIVLDHQPNDYDAEAETTADLVISGHTHGGQLIPLMQFMRWFHIGDE